MQAQNSAKINKMTFDEIEAEVKRLKGLLKFHLDTDYVKWINNRIDELWNMV